VRRAQVEAKAFTDDGKADLDGWTLWGVLPRPSQIVSTTPVSLCLKKFDRRARLVAV
jgi:hypothetical protein